MSYDQKVIENIRELVLEYTKHLNQYLLGIKAEFAEQNQTVAEFQQVFPQTISQYELLLVEKSEDIEFNIRNKTSIPIKIQEQLGKEIGSLTKANKDLENTVAANRIEIGDLKSQKEPLVFTLQRLETANEALRAIVLVIEEESKVKLQEAAEIRQKLTIDYEK